MECQIGPSDVVSDFKMTDGTFNPLLLFSSAEEVVSTTPDTEFRWDPTDKQWIFNLNTKNLNVFIGKTVYYKITLNDGSEINFSFNLK